VNSIKNIEFLWHTDESSKIFVEEARSRNLQCAVIAANQAQPQDNMGQYGSNYICQRSILFTGNQYIWSNQPAFSSYVDEAKRRDLNCPEVANEERRESFHRWKCEENTKECDNYDVCELATYRVNSIKNIEFLWHTDESSKIFVEEARSRNLQCAVIAANQAQQQSIAVAEDAGAAEQKRLADEKKKKADAAAKAAEQKRLADEKKKKADAVAKAAEIKRLADEKKEKADAAAKAAEQKRLADEKKKADAAAKAAEQKRLADEKKEKADAAAKAADQVTSGSALLPKLSEKSLEAFAECEVAGTLILNLKNKLPELNDLLNLFKSDFDRFEVIHVRLRNRTTEIASDQRIQLVQLREAWLVVLSDEWTRQFSFGGVAALAENMVYMARTCIQFESAGLLPQ
jgi:hypothetical protein